MSLDAKVSLSILFVIQPCNIPAQSRLGSDDSSIESVVTLDHRRAVVCFYHSDTELNLYHYLQKYNNNNSMAQCPPLLTRLVASSVTASAHAGKIIRDVLSKGELNIVEKGKNDLQTEADRSAQKCIIESLTRQFPGVTIIGEEGASSCEVPKEWIIKDMDQDVLKLKLPKHLENVEPKDVCVWVDPLDGSSRRIISNLIQ